MNAIQKAQHSISELADAITQARRARAAFMHRPKRPERTMIKPPRFVLIIPRGRNFFHLQDADDGRVLGYRVGHAKACAAARDLERLAAA